MARAFGPLTATTPTGEPLSGATVAYKEPDGATTLAAALYAASSGGSTPTHQTNSKGQLNRYADYAQRAYYTLNGDTTLWPIDFEVDPADVLAMGADGRTITKGYRAVAAMRCASVEGKIRDRGGRVANVDAYAGDTVVNDYAADGTGGDCTAAVTAALADLASWPGGGTLEFGPGTYKYPDVTWIENVVVTGAGIRTTLMHPPNSAVIMNLLGPGFAGLDNVGITNITLDGNYPNNLDFDSGSAELAIGGLDVFVWNCTIKNFNAFGIQYLGTRPVIAHNRILGPNDGAGINSYADLNVYQHRYAGRDGIFSAPSSYATTSALVIGNYVSGLRLPGIFAGGTSGTMILNNHVENCHRSWGPLSGEPFGSYSHSGGGQIGVSSTYGGVSTDFTIADNYIGSTTAPDGNVYASGIEVNSHTNGILDNNIIYDCPGWGITLASTERIAIRGGSMRQCGTSGAVGGSGALNVAANTSKFTVEGVIFSGNAGTGVYAISLSGTTNHYAIVGCLFEGNTINLDSSASGVNRTIWGNVVVDGDPVPNIVGMTGASAYAGQYINTSATGYGLYLQAAADGTQYAIRVRPYSNDRVIWELYGSGESLQRTAITTGVARLDVTQGAAGGYKHLVAQRNAATKWALGMNAADDFVVWNAALNQQNLKVSDAGNMTVRGQTILPAGLVGTPSFVFAGTATGLYSSGSSDMDVSIVGTQRLSFKTNGDIVPGTAALATNATTGFMYVETCAGTPTGVPTAYTGRAAMVFDTTNNKWYIYDGGWIGVTLS